MTNKEKFITMVEGLIEEKKAFENGALSIDQDTIEVTEEALQYFENLKKQKTRSVEMTENGKNIVEFMQKEIEEFDNEFLSREIAEGLFTSSRSVSGAMRKLVTDEYVSKNESSPIGYSLTEKGKEYTLDEDEEA